jgi:nitroimidazol reductase NimA-like FMN-containing flavoprotein (pyridoxamine 5'-phosphate oxidase superfamily)
MPRKDQEITDQGIIEGILATAEVCRLAMVDQGEPYVVPVNFGYRDRCLYVHSAATGRKIDILRRNNRVCFEIEGPSAIVRHAEPCHWGARGRSLIGYGRAEFVADREEKKRGLDAIMAHYGKTDPSTYDEQQLDAVVILRISIESMAGKQVGKWD